MSEDKQLSLVPEVAPKAARKPRTPKPAPEVPEVAAKPKRIGVPLPTSCDYEFKPGQQVYLVNLKHSAARKFRSHYEYVKLSGLMHVIKSSVDGLNHRVWLNKLMPIAQAKALQKQVEAAAKQVKKTA